MARGGAGGGGRGGKSKGPVSRDFQISKKLSWLLRHGAEKEGLALGKGGYASLSDVMRNRNVAGVKPTLAEIKEVVANNDKQRFSLVHVSSSIDDNDAGLAAINNSDTDPKNYLIRANQGHSLKVDDEGLLTPLTLESANLPAMVVHGTRHDAWKQIQKSGGLKPMQRNHVHFATGLPRQIAATRATEKTQPAVQSADTVASTGEEVAPLPDKTETPEVLSGMRATSTILIFLDLPKALGRGIKFSMSENGVVLSEGGEDGLIPVEVFSRVEEKGGRILVDDGRVVAEADA